MRKLPDCLTVYADIERGTVNMRTETILRICNVLHITPRRGFDRGQHFPDRPASGIVGSAERLQSKRQGNCFAASFCLSEIIGLRAFFFSFAIKELLVTPSVMEPCFAWLHDSSPTLTRRGALGAAAPEELLSRHCMLVSCD